MHTLIDTINLTEYNGLKVHKLAAINASEIIKVTLEENTLFPKHISNADATLVVLEGSIIFYINQQEFELLKHQVLQFPKDEEHWVKALKNSKFLIIR